MGNQDLNNKILEIAKDLLDKMGFEAQVSFFDNSFSGSSLPVLSIESENNLSMLIGKNGQNLNAFEHLLRTIVFHKTKDNDQENTIPNFTVDVNDYRKSRAGYVLEIAKNAVSRVISTQKAEALIPMSSYERRLIHTELASCKDVQTESIGEEPRRRVVIKPLVI